MTDPTAVLAGLFTNVSYGIPLLLLSAIAVFWILSRYAHLPPLFRAIEPDRSWVKGPLAIVEEGVAANRIGPAIAYTTYRVDEVLRTRYGFLPTRPVLLWAGQRRVPAEARTLLRTRQTLYRAFYLAMMAETEDRRDLWSRWRRPVWESRSRGLFASALADLEELLPRLEAGT